MEPIMSCPNIGLHNSDSSQTLCLIAWGDKLHQHNFRIDCRVLLISVEF